MASVHDQIETWGYSPEPEGTNRGRLTIYRFGGVEDSTLRHIAYFDKGDDWEVRLMEGAGHTVATWTGRSHGGTLRDGIEAAYAKTREQGERLLRERMRTV